MTSLLENEVKFKSFKLFFKKKIIIKNFEI